MKASPSHHMESLAAHGVWSPVLVPLQPDLGIDSERFIAQAQWLLAQGCHGLALFGTTSEANSFSVAERKALLEEVVEAGISPERLMVGTGCCALTDSVELTRHAVDTGCRRVLMLPPFYYKGMSDEGLFQSFAEVVERVGNPDLRVFLYHFPRLSGVPVTEGLIALLVDAFPEVVAGVKDSSGEWSNTRMMLDRFPRLAIFPGSETFLLDGLRAGGAGCITATSNVNASGARAVFDAWSAGHEDADTRQTAATTIRRAIDRHPGIPAQKFLIARYRNDPAWRTVRPPMTALADEAGHDLLDALSATEFDGARLAIH
ncbi:MAG: dihydrodipicolinate synthase family protein [Thiotrichales bacterium]|nr:dihydrodipicolinate synthase family protein [Thiotrichales bacterium]MCY4348950.1 dihydrodipicolinate synthase family protein [Thiotrichales bacterium]